MTHSPKYWLTTACTFLRKKITHQLY